MKKTIWDIKEGEAYYRLHSSGSIIFMTWGNNDYDVQCRECFSAFLTRDEAEAELNERKKKAQALKPILDEAERRYLKAVVRPFRDRVQYIEKRKTYGKGEEYINISFGLDHTLLPDFKMGTMYRGMELYKAYTLEELGL